jgi:protein-S-isoprenylcysteine O-methyltransferase Ste14
MNTQYAQIAYWSWLVLFLVWLPGYFTGKGARDAPHLRLQRVISVLLVACFVLLFGPTLLGLGMPITPQTALFGMIGLMLDLIGIAFAIWARLVLWRSWAGLIVTVREEDQLVQWGPYAIVRHPIYAGLLLALSGTTLTLGTMASYLGLAAGVAAFMMRASLEETALGKHFDEAYRDYQQRTKKIIPFVW